MTDSQLRVLWAGDCRHSEFLETRNWLESHADLRCLDEVGAVVDHLASPSLPVYDLILIGQARPGQIDQRGIDRLHAAAPLTPMLAILGTWCEGEMRTGIPWKGIPRFYWHQLLPALASETVSAADTPPGAPTHRHRPPLVGLPRELPRTVTEPERFLHAARQPIRSRKATRNVRTDGDRTLPYRGTGIWLIRAETRVTFESLAECLRWAGIDSLWWPARAARPLLHRLAGLVWDTEQLDELEWGRLEANASIFQNHPSVILANFPRREEACRLSSLGIASMLSKPFQMEWLLHEIVRLEAEWEPSRSIRDGTNSVTADSTAHPRDKCPMDRP